MKSLHQIQSGKLQVPLKVSSLLSDLGERVGKQELFTRQSPQRLKVLRENYFYILQQAYRELEGFLFCGEAALVLKRREERPELKPWDRWGRGTAKAQGTLVPRSPCALQGRFASHIHRNSRGKAEMKFLSTIRPIS